MTADEGGAATERVRRAGQVAWAAVGVAALIAVIGIVLWTVRVVFPPLVFAAAIDRKSVV